MESVARFILNNAQTVYDGGVIASILENINLFSANATIMQQIMPYAILPRMSGGFVAALIFGCLWLIFLVTVMAYLCHAQCCRHSKAYFSKIQKNGGIERNRRESFQTSKLVNIFLGVFMLVILLWSFFLICFYMGSVTQLQHSINQSPRSFQANSTEPIALMPAVKNSLFYLKYYLVNFAPEARKNTAPIVEKIVADTVKMQKETQKNFNSILMRRIGVADTFRYGAQMSDFVVRLFDISNGVNNETKKYNSIMDQLFPSTSDPQFSIFVFLKEIRNALNQSSSCDLGCQRLKLFFSKRFSRANSYPETKFATSFLFLMDKENKTREGVLAQAADGQRKMDEKMAKTEARMKELIDIPNTIRNMTAANWDKMDIQFSGVAAEIDKYQMLIASEAVATKTAGYGVAAAAGLLLPAILALIVLLATAAGLYMVYMPPPRGISNKRQRSAVSLALAAGYGLVALLLLWAMLLFLYAGMMETELCRYLRTNQPMQQAHSVNGSSSYLALDPAINRWLVLNLAVLTAPKPGQPPLDFPVPMPRNVLYGLIHRCVRNDPILVALDAISSLDTSKLSKPEMSAKFTRVGRQLMEEGLNDTDPAKLVPPDMKATLDQAGKLDMFRTVDVEGQLAQLPSGPLAIVDKKDITLTLSVDVLLNRVQKAIVLLQQQSGTASWMPTLLTQQQQLQTLLQRHTVVCSRLRAVFRQILQLPDIGPIVKSLRSSLDEMLALMADKPRLLAIANDQFDRVIEATTPAKAAATMAKFGPQMMAQLGHCRPIFLAYRSLLDTVCSSSGPVPRLNSAWVYLGTLALLLTFLLVLLSSLIARQRLSPPKSSLDQQAASTLLATKFAPSGDMEKTPTPPAAANTTKVEEAV